MGTHKAVTRADAHAPGEVADYLDFAEVAAPATPASGFVRIYPKSDGVMYQKDDAGTETALGSGGSGAMTVIGETVLGSAAATITFASIPGTYRHLQLDIVGRGSDAAAAVACNFRFNTDTGSNYHWQRQNGDATTASASQGASATSGRVGGLPGGGAPANRAGSFRLVIPDYRGTTFHKTAHSSGGFWGSTVISTEQSSSTWHNTAAITQIDLIVGAGNFLTGTVATLYGLATA